MDELDNKVIEPTTKNIDKGAIARLIASIVAMLNTALTMLGISPIPIDDEQIIIVVTVVADVIIWAWSYWKNNSYTNAAKVGDAAKDIALMEEKQVDNDG